MYWMTSKCTYGLKVYEESKKDLNSRDGDKQQNNSKYYNDIHSLTDNSVLH